MRIVLVVLRNVIVDILHFLLLVIANIMTGGGCDIGCYLCRACAQRQCRCLRCMRWVVPTKADATAAVHIMQLIDRMDCTEKIMVMVKDVVNRSEISRRFGFDLLIVDW